MINVSEILLLRPIKVNNGKFYLLLRSGYFVDGCVFARVYVICNSHFSFVGMLIKSKIRSAEKAPLPLSEGKNETVQS